MSGKLSVLRSHLQALQGKRALVRWGNAACAVLMLMIGLLVAAFIFDCSLRLSFGYRFLMLGGWLAAMAWGVHKFAWPAISTRESIDDLALVVERRHQIDSDLIGALQFESADAAQWGSSRLTAAVIDYVAEFSPGLNVFEGFTYERLPRRLAMVALMLLAVLISFAVFPGHVSAFWNRFWLGSARYPSKTQITQLTVNGQSVDVIARGTPAPLSLPQGSSLHIEAVCEGEIPSLGMVQLLNRADREDTRFELKPTGPDAPGKFVAEHPLPSDDVELQVFAGDTWSDPVTIRIVPLPVVDVLWHIELPKYAAAAEKQEPGAAARYLSVLEGSELQLSVRGTNKKLARAELRLGEEHVIPLVSSGKDESWSLPPGSPLAPVRQGWSYEIHAEDEHGLSLKPPIAGSIRLQPDRAPRVASAVVTKLVIPTAKPRLAYGAVDDYGVSQIRVQVEVTRSSGETETKTRILKQVPTENGAPSVVREEIRLDLTPYKLEKGDEIRLTVEALDYRGGLEPKVGSGEPLLLKVTDRSGILAGLNESDQYSVKQLDTIIQRELGIGGDKR